MPSSPNPPKTPKDPKALSPPADTTTAASPPKRKSPSFSSLIRPSSIHSVDETPSSSGTEREGGKLATKVKEFFTKDKRVPSGSNLSDQGKQSVSGSSTGNAEHENTSSSGTFNTPLSPPDGGPSSTSNPSNALQIAIASNDSALFRSVSSTGQPVMVAQLTGSDQFEHAVQSAQTSVDRMQTASVWLGFAAQGLSAAGAWLPMVGHGVQAVVTMLEMAKEIGIAKVAALRLVERCADILEAVLKKLKAQNGTISLDLRQDINRLLTNIHNTAFLLTKLAARPFFKLWLHAGEVQDQIAEATTEIDIFFSIFHVEAVMTTNMMLEQAKRDREADQTILRDMIQAGIRDEGVLLTMLVKKAEEQQEAIKTLQRALDNLTYAQAQAPDPALAHSPQDSPDIPASRPPELYGSSTSLAIAIPASNPLWLPDSTGHSPTASFASGYSDTSHLSVQAETGDSSNEEPFKMMDQIDVTGQRQTGEAVPDAGTATSMPTARIAAVRTAAASQEQTDPRRQFIEKALDVLRRQSAATDFGVPEWTITYLEVTHEIRLATSFFSTIWKGKWQGEQVAIKELHRNIDRSLFTAEIEVWRRLRSKHILPFFGASSTTGPPPWFMVSPYMKNGDVLNYVRKTAKLWTAGERRQHVWTLIKEMAEGMEYLHSRDICHGDFKAANVLVSDVGEALICDFGLSQLKHDLNNRSQDDPEAARSRGGTMRWQSPERLLGKVLTNACDVYSFAVTVCEVYSLEGGEATPFGYMDDAIVRRRVLDGCRPDKPDHTPKALWAMIERCWAQEAADRPTFEVIVQDLTKILDAEADKRRSLKSKTGSPSTSTATFDTAPESVEPEEQHAISPQLAQRPLPDDDGVSSSSGSIRSIPQHLAKEISFESDRAERHYRHYLNHEFDDRLTVPLWFPAEIPLGSVGYIRHGQFVELLDANRPPPDVQELPPVLRLDEFDSLMTKKTAVNVQNVADKGWEMVHSAWMNFIKSSGEKSQKAISRQYTYPLKPGGKQALLIVDDADFEIYKSFSEARAYLTGNIDWILKYYSDAHHISKEDVLIVVGTLSAHNYAMAVSKFAPRTTLMFNVHAESQRLAGEPWGTWAVNRQKVPDEPELQYICKVSTVSASPRDTVLLAKLKFAPGGEEPALYP